MLRKIIALIGVILLTLFVYLALTTPELTNREVVYEYWYFIGVGSVLTTVAKMMEKDRTEEE